MNDENEGTRKGGRENEGKVNRERERGGGDGEDGEESRAAEEPTREC